MSLNQFVELTATTPAKLFGLFPKKGTIAVGSDADIVLFDPSETWNIRAAEHHSRIDYSLFEGRPVTGRVKKVFLRGELVVDGERWLGREGRAISSDAAVLARLDDQRVIRWVGHCVCSQARLQTVSATGAPRRANAASDRSIMSRASPLTMKTMRELRSSSGHSGR